MGMDGARVVRVIDGRHLEPPDPFILTMEALDEIEPGQRLLLQLGREPYPLYRALEINGYAWQTNRLEDGTVEILIWQRIDE